MTEMLFCPFEDENKNCIKWCYPHSFAKKLTLSGRYGATCNELSSLPPPAQRERRRPTSRLQNLTERVFFRAHLDRSARYRRRNPQTVGDGHQSRDLRDATSVRSRAHGASERAAEVSGGGGGGGGRKTRSAFSRDRPDNLPVATCTEAARRPRPAAPLPPPADKGGRVTASRAGRQTVL